MLIKQQNGLNTLYDKHLELILGVFAAYLKKYPEEKEELDFIECPDIPYVNELINLIAIEKRDKLKLYIQKAFPNCDMLPSIAMGLTDCEIDKTKMKDITLQYGTLEEFVNLIKELAIEINWNTFFEKKQNYYSNLANEFSDFPSFLDLKDIEKFYGHINKSYNFIPSILMNGGFGVSDKQGNLYYIRGIRYDEISKKFVYDKEYLLECLFHEFSHPIVNRIVDKYYNEFINIDEFYKEAVVNGLPKYYQNKKTLLYEYFVRANANILNLKYYPETKVEDCIVNYGFIHLEKIISFILNNKAPHEIYEDFFREKLIPFVININKEENENLTL